MGTRMRSWAQTVTPTGGGGSVPTVGNLAWGPDFGEGSGNDGKTTSIGMHTDMPAIGFTNNKTVGIHTDMTALALVYNDGVGVYTSGTVLGAPFLQTSSALAGTATGGTTTIAAPSGVQNGDLLVALISSLDATVGNSINTPSGWTLIKHSAGAALNVPSLGSYYRVASGEPANYTFTSTAGVMNATILRIVAFDTSTPINTSSENTASATDPVALSVTTTVVNCMRIVACSQANNLSATYTPPTRHTEVSDLTATSSGVVFMTGEVAYRMQAASGASGNQTMDSTQLVASNYKAHHIAIAPGTLTIAS